MRFFVAILAVLAGVKVYAHDQTNQTLLKSALIDAYRNRAIRACHDTAAAQPGARLATRWHRPHEIDVSIGEPRPATTLWSDIAYKVGAQQSSVFLVLTPPGPHAAHQCNFDTTSGRAAIRAIPRTGL